MGFIQGAPQFPSPSSVEGQLDGIFQGRFPAGTDFNFAAKAVFRRYPPVFMMLIMFEVHVIR
jgi:hypothetical protein